MSYRQRKQKVKIGKLFGGVFYDLTAKFVEGTSITQYENKIDFASFVAVNNFKTANYIQHVEGTVADGYHLDVHDILQVYRVSDNKLIYTGQISEPMQQISVNGSFLSIQTYSYPAVGLNRCRVNNTYGTFNKPMTLREILVSGKETTSTLFPYTEADYTENCTVSPYDNLNVTGYDWTCATYPTASTTTYTALVTSEGSYTAKVGTHFIKFGNTAGKDFNARFGALASAPHIQGFPLMIDDLSMPIYNTVTQEWNGVPYIDFYIYRHNTGSNDFSIEMQLRVNDSDYMRFQLTDQDHSGLHWWYPSSENQNLNLFPTGGGWVHLRIPCGSKWGEGKFYVWRSGDADVDWAPSADTNIIAVSHTKVKSWMCATGVTDIIGTDLTIYLGWDAQHSSGEGNQLGDPDATDGSACWNQILDINFLVQNNPVTGPTATTFGLDSFTIGNLNAGNITVYDYISNSGPVPYNIDFDYVGNIVDTSSNPYLLPYVNCIWEQGTKTLMDICNLIGGVAYRDAHSPGIHWTTIPYMDSTTPKTYLTIAPLGNHDIDGLDSSHKPESIWATNSKYTLTHPLILPANIVNATFTKQEAEANFVIANAVFQDPPLNEWMQETFTRYTSSGNYYWTSTNWVYIPDPTNSDPINVYPTAATTNVAGPGDAVVGPLSIAIPHVSNNPDIGGAGFTDILYLMVPDWIDLNLIKNPKLTFRLKGFHLQTVEYRVYTDLYDVPVSIPPTAFSGASSLAGEGLGNYFWSEIPNANIDGSHTAGFWKKYDISLGSGEWNITNHATWSKPIKMILFRVVGESTSINPGRFYLDGLSINGVHLRGAYSNNAISAMGGMKQALINEVVYSGDKLAASEIDQLDNLLIAECNRDITTPTVGTVKLPLDFDLMQGTMFWLSSPPFGASPKQFRCIWVKHEVAGELSTTICLTDDIVNSYARDPTDALNRQIKAINPDQQNRTFVRLAVAGIPSRSLICKIVDVDAI
jgi:hypothetical protein